MVGAPRSEPGPCIVIAWARHLAKSRHLAVFFCKKCLPSAAGVDPPRMDLSNRRFPHTYVHLSSTISKAALRRATLGLLRLFQPDCWVALDEVEVDLVTE